MGLDVTAYRKLTKLDAVFDADGEPMDRATNKPIEAYFQVRINDDFPGRAEGLENKAVYSYQEADDFWSGGYGSYGRWREQLAKLAEYPATEITRFGATEKLHSAACWNGATGPFSELINFTDCDGIIGAPVAAKLLKDFQDWDERAQAIGDGFYERYAEWTSCFVMAADGGAVSFH